jgi:hypothetical protein
MNNRKIGASVLGLVLVLACLVNLSHEKRLGGLGRRTKPKNNLSVRRQQSAPSPVPVPAPKPVSSSANTGGMDAKPIGWNTGGQAPVGPPPAYPGLGHNSVAANGAPPAYSPSFGSPPSYSALLNRESHIGKIPPRGQPSHYGSHDHTSFVGLGGGHNAYGGPSFTGIHSPNVGGYSGVNSGTGMGGLGMASGGYGSGYGYGGRSPFSFGNILTGLALWQVARGFNSYPSHRTVHIYEHRNETGQPTDTVASEPISPQDPYAPPNNPDPYQPYQPPQDVYNPVIVPEYPTGPSVDPPAAPSPPPVPEFNVYGYGYGYPYGDQTDKALLYHSLPSDNATPPSSQSPQSSETTLSDSTP